MSESRELKKLLRRAVRFIDDGSRPRRSFSNPDRDAAAEALDVEVERALLLVDIDNALRRQDGAR